METWQIVIVVAAIVLALFLTLIIILAIQGDKVDEEHVWTDKKHTIFGLPISFTRYILTDRKLITRTGLFTLHEDELDLYRVVDKKLCIPFGQRLFNCGTIIITAKDADTPNKELKSVKNVRAVLKKLDECVDAERTRYSVRGRDMIGGVGPAHPADIDADICPCDEHNN